MPDTKISEERTSDDLLALLQRRSLGPREQFELIHQLRLEGETLAAIGKRLGVSRQRVHAVWCDGATASPEYAAELAAASREPAS